MSTDNAGLLPMSPKSSMVARIFVFSVLVALLFRLLRCYARIRKVRRSIPVVPVLFPSTSRFRLLYPKKWQRYHRDWHMQIGRQFYRESDIVALISLFEYDQMFVSDPAAVLETYTSGRFQKDLVQASKVSCPRISLIEDCDLRAKCGFNRWF
jgi:hypothetical protein